MNANMIDQSAGSGVTLEDLEAILSRYPRLDSNPLMDAHLLALITTERFMGRDWCVKWLFPFSRENKNRPGNYFFPNETPDDPLEVLRQTRFAELLFNLQRLDGFDERTKEWRGHEPEAVVAELESLFYMMSCGHLPSFVSSAECSGRCRDFDVVLRWGQKAVNKTKF